MGRMVNFSSISLDPAEIIDFLRGDLRLEEIYREIIGQKIIAQVAQDHGLIVTPEEIQMAVEQFCIERGLDYPAHLSAWLSEHMLTLSELKQQIERMLFAKKLSKELFSERIQLLFTQDSRQFEQILLYRIVVPYQSLAQEVFYQIEEEEISFYEAAHLYDIDERRRLQCGYEGQKQRHMLQPELTDILFNARVGEVVGPIKTPEDTYELFLIDDFLPPSLTPELYENTLQQMLQEWLNNEIALYVSHSH